ncbi:AAA family ATPase [Parahaliea maris]|uniref:AAA family ATPase n=1 Tax=Parahaliea maris TaxID=2716870 RepID=A0A5C9A890_9GAMM|nr:AAA family ATPase [Parahaliea maris]TXS95441.1 AAA family ATPase [Parahaliea maris]
MKLLSLTVDQVRQFRAPFTLDGLAPGINLISGPNESGKSTLVQAIRAAFFERYASSSVDYLQPWGDSSAAPSVELLFEAQGARWHLRKRFLKKKRCDLTIDGQSCSNDEAEEKLAGLLGFQFAKKGASKPDHWGIPGLLWVEQGGGQSIEAPVSHASEHLQSALNSLLGEVASSSGDDLIQQVEQQRQLLLTAAGKPRGEYAELATTCSALEGQLDDLDTRIRHYRERVDRLALVQTEHRRAEQERPWESQLQEADKSARQLAAIEQEQRELQRDEDQRRQTEATLQAYRDQQAQAHRQARELQQRKVAEADAEAALETLQQASEPVQANVAAAQQAYDNAARELQQAREWERRDGLEKALQQATEQLAEGLDALQRAEQLQQSLAGVRQALGELRIDEAVVEDLEQLTAELTDTGIRLEAIATRVSYQLDPGVSITLAGEQVSESGETLLTDATRMSVPGVGSFEITPGGTDINALRRTQSEQQAAVASLLAETGVSSLEEARNRAREQRRLAEDAKRLDAELRAVAPGGLDLLRERHAECARQCDTARQQLQALPAAAERTGPSPDVEAAQQTQQDAAGALKAVEARREAHQLELSRAEVRLDSARTEVKQLANTLAAPEFKARENELADQLLRTEQALAACLERIERRQREIDAARPDLLQQDIERLRSSATILQETHQKRAEELASLRSALQSEGAHGLEEERATLENNLQHNRRRHAELERRARALDLLLSLLTERRQELTRRLQAPLQKHLDHYLGILFPDAGLQVNDALVPEQFQRKGELGRFADLSFGAREQTGLIARLAYADLLQEAGRPTLIILDDSLVHSDRERQGIMQRVLFDAARRHQILLFTCHPENWQGLGVAPRDLPALKLGTAGA